MEESKNKFHALQLFTDTFAAETVHLSNEEVGIYIRLLCFAWTKNAKPFSIRSAYRIGQCIDDDCKGTVKKILYKIFLLLKRPKHKTGQWFLVSTTRINSYKKKLKKAFR